MIGKIACIKRLREAFGLELLEAKRIADGEYKFADYVNVETFSDNGSSLVPYEYLQALHEIGRRQTTTARINERDLSEYYQARRNQERAVARERKAIHNSAVAENALNVVRERILGRDAVR